MKVLELKGFKSLRALNGFHSLLLGMKMLPMHIAQSYVEFYKDFELLPEKEQRATLKEAALFVELDKDEVEAIVSFCCDPNGIPYEASNIKNLSPDQLIEAIVSVCFEIGKIKIDFVTDEEKKNLDMVPSMFENTSLKTQLLI